MCRASFAFRASHIGKIPWPSPILMIGDILTAIHARNAIEAYLEASNKLDNSAS